MGDRSFCYREDGWGTFIIISSEDFSFADVDARGISFVGNGLG